MVASTPGSNASRGVEAWTLCPCHPEMTVVEQRWSDQCSWRFARNGRTWLRSSIFAFSLQINQVAAKSLTLGTGASSPASTRWRVVNLRPVTYGWQVGEVGFFSDPGCTQALVSPAEADVSGSNASSASLPQWSAIASGHHGGASPVRAIDGFTWTEWKAQCYICEPEEAWVGVEFAIAVKVMCVRLWQWGSREYMSEDVLVERWDHRSSSWDGVLQGSLLDGGRWETVQFTRCQEILPPDEGHVEISNGGFYPSEATFTCAGARILGGSQTEVCFEDGSWSGSGAPRCWALMEIIIAGAALVVLWLFIVGIYVCVEYSQKPPVLQATTFLGYDTSGTWSSAAFADFRSDPRTVALVVCCPLCRIADTWHGAGQVQFRYGLTCTHCCCCLLPMLGACQRTNLRDRFRIKGSKLKDTILWLLCCLCAAVQEAKHVDLMRKVAEDERMVQEADAELRRREEMMLHENLALGNDMEGAAGPTKSVAKPQRPVRKNTDEKMQKADAGATAGTAESNATTRNSVALKGTAAAKAKAAVAKAAVFGRQSLSVMESSMNLQA